MILTIANQRGGAGKTTSAAALAQAAAYRGRKTLAVDLDPQGSDIARLMTRMIFHPSEVQYICQKVDASTYKVALLHANVNSQNSQQRQ